MATISSAAASAIGRRERAGRGPALWLLLAALSGVALLAWLHAGVQPQPALAIDHESGALRLVREIGPARCIYCAPAEQSFGSPASAVAPAAPEPLVIARSLGHLHGRPRDDRAPAGHAVAPLDPPPNA
jgi:hypothetical protein